MINWILIGLITGVAGILFAPRNSSVLGTVILGVLGAILGGFLGMALFTEQQSTFYLPVLLVVIFSSIFLVSLQRAVVKD